MWKLLLLLVLPLPLLASDERVCAHYISLETVGRQVIPVVGPREFIASNVELLPMQRVAYGTAIANESGFRLPGGRIIIQDLDEKTPAVAFEPPAQGPLRGVSEVKLSPDGQYLGFTPGKFPGGPVLIYRTSPLELVCRTQVMSSPSDLGDHIANDIKGTREGDPRADLIRALLAAGANEGEEDDKAIPYPAHSVEFHPTGDRYLINAGTVATVHRLSDGQEIERVVLEGTRLNSHPSKVFFLGGGEFILELEQLGKAKLRRFSTGQVVDVAPQPAGWPSPKAPILTAPNAAFVSAGYATRDKDLRVIWGITRNALGESPAIIKEFSFPASDPDTLSRESHFPPIGFSNANSYAIGLPAGEIEVFSLVTHMPIQRFSIGRDNVVESVAVSPDSEILAIGGGNSGEKFIELRTTKTSDAIRIKLPHPPNGEVQKIKRLAFFSLGGMLVIEVQRSNTTGLGVSTIVPYIIDAYRAMALATKAK